MFHHHVCAGAARVPEGFSGGDPRKRLPVPLLLVFDAGCEGMVWDPSGVPRQGLNDLRTEYVLATDAVEGQVRCRQAGQGVAPEESHELVALSPWLCMRWACCSSDRRHAVLR